MQAHSTTGDTSANSSTPKFWAKAGTSRDVNHYHPVICHLMDTAAVATRLLRHHLSAPARRVLMQGLGFTDEEAMIQWVAFLAGSHDLGKVSPAFQFQVEAVGRPLVGEPYFNAWCRHTQFSEPVPHGQVTAARLPDYLAELGLNGPLARRLASLVGGHHGYFPTALELQNLNAQQVGPGRWMSFRKTLLDQLSAYMRLECASEKPIRCDPAAGMLLAGLTTVSDWLASSEEFFPYSPDIDPTTYGVGLAAKAQRVMASMGWLGIPAAEPRTFEALFPEIAAPRPLQHAVAQLVGELASPALMLVEAAMGEGKTEAAFFVADHWQHGAGAGGFYVGLPTQATSNQMWQRAQRFLRQRYPDDVINLTLSHSHAALRGDYMSTVCRLDQVYDQESRVVASEWHTARKRSLLSPFGVGTIDQGLMGVVRSRHQFVRLFGLAGRCVVLDEVHAYDLYTSTLIERLVEWLAVLGSPVVALSATLPRTLRERLVGAYARGLGMTAPTILEAEYPRVTALEKRGCRSVSFAASEHVSRSLVLEWRDESDWMQGVVAAVSAGANVAVLCSTVRRAQRVYAQLATVVPPDQRDLFHARFLVRDREQLENRCLERFGKDGERPSGSVLVATQVIEQSLDLDFDLMITDMAPIDLLLQRSGRVHRHRREGDERGGFTQPTLWVIRPEITATGALDFKEAGRVYDAHVLARTWWRLRGLDSLALPGVMDELIEAVYDPQLEPWEGLSPAECEAWMVTREANLNDTRVRQFTAEQACVPHPEADREPEEYTRMRIEDDEAVIQAVTRLGQESLTAIALRRHHGAWVTARTGEAVSLDSAPKPALLRSLMGHGVRISHPAIVRSLKAQPHPEGWTAGLLRPCVPLKLGSDGACELAGWTVRLDDELGLVIERGQEDSTDEL